MFISVQQKDMRMEGSVKYTKGIGMEIQKVQRNDLPCLLAPHSHSFFSSTFNKGREITSFLFFEPGLYSLVPSTFLPLDETLYYLSAYSLFPVEFQKIQYQDFSITGSWTSQHGGYYFYFYFNIFYLYFLLFFIFIYFYLFLFIFFYFYLFLFIFIYFYFDFFIKVVLSTRVGPITPNIFLNQLPRFQTTSSKLR